LDQVAQDVQFEDRTLVKILNGFDVISVCETQKLRDWIVFHREMPYRKKYRPESTNEPSETILRFVVQQSRRFETISDRLALSPTDAVYAFNVYQRGQMYLEILSNQDAVYFSHPMRRNLHLSKTIATEIEQRAWSWGRILAQLIKDRQVSRSPDEVADLVCRIRQLVLLQGLTWYDQTLIGSSWRDAQSDIAVKIGLPARLSEKVCRFIETAMVAFAGGIESTGILPPFVATLIVLMGTFKLNVRERYVPGRVGEIPFVRGELRWPTVNSVNT
jgi:hypothetical protein